MYVAQKISMSLSSVDLLHYRMLSMVAPPQVRNRLVNYRSKQGAERDDCEGKERCERNCERVTKETESGTCTMKSIYMYYRHLQHMTKMSGLTGVSSFQGWICIENFLHGRLFNFQRKLFVHVGKFWISI